VPPGSTTSPERLEIFGLDVVFKAKVEEVGIVLGSCLLLYFGYFGGT